MTAERDRKIRYEEYLRQETKVELAPDGHFPKSFFYNDQPVDILTTLRARTEIRSKSLGSKRVNRTYYEVRTKLGLFELVQDSVMDSWTIVGKLRE